MTVEMWMGLGIVVAIIGFIMWRAGRIKYAGKEKPKRRYGYYDSVVTSHGWSNDRIFIFQSKVFKLIFKFQRK